MILQVMNRSTPWKVNERIPNKDGPAGTCSSGFQTSGHFGYLCQISEGVDLCVENITNCFWRIHCDNHMARIYYKYADVGF